MALSAGYMPRRPNVISDIIDDEVVIIDMTTGAYYSLDRCGTVVWQALEAGLTVDEAIEQVQQRYDGEPAAVAQAVAQLVARLEEEKLMLARPAGAAGKTGALPPATGSRQPFAPPVLQKYDDMQDLIMLDPIHQVDETGWPARKPAASAP